MRRKLTEDLSVQVLSDTDADTAPGTPRLLSKGTEIALEPMPASRRPLPDRAILLNRKTAELVVIPARDDEQPQVLRLPVASWNAVRRSPSAKDVEPELESFNASLNGLTGQAGRELSYGWLNVAGFSAGGPGPEDIVQGGSGSCFVLATAAASLVPHPQSASWHPHPWREVITPVGTTNSLYKVNFRREGGSSPLYVSAAVPFLGGTGVMSGANRDISEGNALGLPAWPVILEKAWIQFRGDFSGLPESVMEAVGMTDVSGAADPNQIPALFADGQAIVVKGNRHAYYVSAVAGQQVTIVDQRTPLADRASGNARAVTPAHPDWGNYVVKSKTWPRPFTLNIADFAAAQFTVAQGRPA